MPRPIGSKNHGFWSTLEAEGKELPRKLKKQAFEIDSVAKTFEAFRRKLNKAINLSSLKDPREVQRLASGINALSKGLMTIQRIRNESSTKSAFTLEPIE